MTGAAAGLDMPAAGIAGLAAGAGTTGLACAAGALTGGAAGEEAGFAVSDLPNSFLKMPNMSKAFLNFHKYDRCFLNSRIEKSNSVNLHLHSHISPFKLSACSNQRICLI
jgi:hypothetical protein